MKEISANYTLVEADNNESFVLSDSITITVPSPTDIVSKTFKVNFKNNDSISQTFSGYISKTLTAGNGFILEKDGSRWVITDTDENYSENRPVPITEGGTGQTTIDGIRSSIYAEVYTPEDTPTNAKYADEILTFSGLAIAAETVTADTEVYEYVAALSEAYATTNYNITGTVNDGEALTLNARSYEFDNDLAIASNWPIDISAGTKTQATTTFDITGVVKEGETFTIDTEIYEADANGSVTAGNIAVDLSAFMVASQGTLTIGGANLSNNDDMTIGLQTYVFKTALTGAANEILIGLTISDTINNIVYAVNDSPFGEGILYGNGTLPNADVTAAKTAGNIAVFTAKIWGTVGDAIPTTSNFADGANLFDAVTLGTTTSGVDCPAADADGAIISAFNTNTALDITASQGAGTTVDFDADAAGALDGSLGNAIASTTTFANATFTSAVMAGGSDATAAEAAAAILVALAADPLAEVTGVAGAGDSVDLTAIVLGTAGNFASTTTAANGAFTGATLTGGVDAVPNEVVIGVSPEACIDNLVAAINGAAGEGTTYATGTTPCAVATAAKTAADKMTLTADTIGTGGNSIAIDETLTNAAWTAGATNLSGGQVGTVGVANEIKQDATYLYVCIAANTTTGANWRRISLGTAY